MVYMQTDRQTHKQTDRQTNRQTGLVVIRQTNKQTDRQTGKQANKTNKQTGRQKQKQINKHTNRNKHTKRQTDKTILPAERQRQTDTPINRKNKQIVGFWAPSLGRLGLAFDPLRLSFWPPWV